MKQTSKSDFSKRLSNMCRVDFRRLFTTPLIYIMMLISLLMPILILVMTTKFSGTAAGVESSDTASVAFTNVWQAIGSIGAAGGMDLTAMCNINLIYFLVVVFVCVFVAEDFKSGFAKNIFTIRSKKADYVCSKTLVGFVASIFMFLIYFVGAIVGGKIAGLSFSTEGFGVGGIICCMISKIMVSLIFVSISLALGCFGKHRAWLSLLCSFMAGMLLFAMIPMVTPLTSNAVNIMMCLAGGVMFAVGLGAVSNLILNKSSLV